MAKYEYSLNEILTYKREMIIETELTENELYRILDNAERHNDLADDVASYLESEGIKIIERPDTDLSSPWEMEIEEDDIVEI